MISLLVTSSVFGNNKQIPRKYTCDGEDVNPPLEIEGIPQNTKSLVLIVDDPDAPMGTWEHWNVWNIPPTSKIKENSIPGVEGMNDFAKHSYGGPCPPSGVHRYFFKIYALDKELSLPDQSSKKDLIESMEGHVLARGELVGLYSR
ncbi:MAG: YbhB/YbcL family Raf kinase inhibitor-like protein [Candidatus Bathyarchaeota archaeon]|jgi:Raf kinase inhibitor-like YbhB/YbcL family protein|nr:YbhB/YbcL family Raf kinase inhibitor-like protein [Candidatus Bathyarchaeota archaeon]